MSTTLSSASGIISRTRSSPVTPRCTAPAASWLRDFRCRKVGDFDAVETGDRAAIVARAARLDELEPGAREERLGILLQPPFCRDGENERRAHDAPP